MGKRKSKIIALLVVTALATIGLISTGQAEATRQKLEVWFGQNSISYNSQDITAQVTPVVINGSTYLPLRKMADLFKKDITWEQLTKTVVLADKADSTVSDLQSQITSKNEYISLLESQIKNFKDEAENNSTTLNNLKKQLNNDYESYSNASFDISLSGDKSDITVTINTDKTDWNAITSSKQKKYLQNIVDDILNEFSDADVTGKVKDGSTVLQKFSITSSGSVQLEADSSVVSDLEDTLNTKLEDDDFGTLTGIDNSDLSIVLDGDTDSVSFKIKINLGSYQTKWDALSDSEIKTYMKSIYRYITSKSSFTDTNVTGYFYDTKGSSTIAKLYSSGASFKRY